MYNMCFQYAWETTIFFLSLILYGFHITHSVPTYPSISFHLSSALATSSQIKTKFKKRKRKKEREKRINFLCLMMIIVCMVVNFPRNDNHSYVVPTIEKMNPYVSYMLKKYNFKLLAQQL